MKKAEKRYFDHVPPSVGGHFVIYLYAAIYRLIYQIHRLADMGSAPLDKVFDTYPFLGEYFNEMRNHMPADIQWGEATQWWHQQILAWEGQCDMHLPLKALADEAGIDFAGCLAFMVTGLVEEDSRFGTLFADLQAPLPHRRPTLELVGQMMMDEAMVGTIDPWSICRPLLDLGLVVSANGDAPRSEWLLKIPPLLWDALRGQMPVEPAAGCRYHPMATLTHTGDLIVDAQIGSRIEKIPSLADAGMIRTVILRSAQGANTVEVMGAVARRLGKGLLEIDGTSVLAGENAGLVGALCAMARAMPVIIYDPGPGETVRPPGLKRYAGLVGIILGLEGGLSGDGSEKSVTLRLPSPDAHLRSAYWKGAVNGHTFEDLPQITRRFRLPGAFIRRVADIAAAHAGLEGRDTAGMEDVRTAGRTLNRQILDTLASPLEATGCWNDLVAGETTTVLLHELFRRCRHRETLLEHLGPAFRHGSNCGVRCLFTGASGTGKTLAAKILVAELGMDLYRVDLAAIINKYIGETEKNLHRVLSRAEALDVVLLLDEGDALLGHRTEVKSANDRYANLETNYLLQRLENYEGIVLITTNLVENIDRAFQRRMDVVVPFFPPRAEERLHILELHLPPDHAVDRMFLERCARRCALNGGQLRNAALHATLLSLDEDTRLCPSHLKEGLRSEYRKAGATFPLDSEPDADHRDGGMSAMIDALSAYPKE